MSETGHVVLVRHAKRVACWDRPERDHPMDGWDPSCSPVFPASNFSRSGYEKTYALAGRLADQLGRVRVERIAHSKHLVALQTAQVFAAVLRTRGLFKGDPEEEEDLTPPDPRPLELHESAIEANTRAVAQVMAWARPNVPRAVNVLVGHQPMLTEIASALLNERLPLKVLPLESSEIACIVPGPSGRLAWCLTAKSDALLAELMAKIRSKFEVAKFLLGALVVNTSLLLNEKLWQSDLLTHKIMTGLAMVAALMALALTVGTLFAYDRLLMPSPFWSELPQPRRGRRRNVERPPSQLQLTLFYEMVHVWKYLFTPAMVLAVSAVMLFAVVQAHRSASPLIAHLQDPTRWRTGAALMAFTVVVAVAALLLPFWWYRWEKPQLGPED